MKLHTSPTQTATRRVILMGEGPEDRRALRGRLAHGVDGQEDVVEVEAADVAVREVLRDPAAPPDCLLLADADLVDRVLAALVRPGGLAPCPVVVLLPTADPPRLRGLLRAGAQEVLERARLTDAQLREAIERAHERWSIARDLVRTERTLEATVDLLRLFVEHAPASIAMFDRDMRYVAASRRWAADFDLEALPILGRSHYDVFPDLPERWREVHRRALAGEVVTAEEDRFDRADGTVQWLRWETRPWPRRDGIGGILISCEDITARRRTEQTLRESNEWLRLALTAGGMGAWTWDPQTDEAWWDSGLEALIGVHPGPGPTRGAEFFARIHPDDVATVRADTERAFQDGGSYSHEFRFVRPDGRVIWLAGQAAATRDARGRTTRLTGINFDVTERKRAEEQLRRSQETFSRLIQNTPFGIYVVDADLRVWQVSQGAHKVFAGVDPLLGRDFAEVLRIIWTEPFASDALERFRRTLATGEPFGAPGTTERRADTGADESYDWRIERITLPDGRFGVVCYFYDLSERQRLEAALRASEERVRFLLRLSDDVRAETDPQRIVAAAMEALRRQVGADRAAWAEVEADEDHFVFAGSSVAEGVTPVEGRFPVSAFDPTGLQRMRAGLPLVVHDVAEVPATAEHGAYAATGIAALIAVPLHKGGRFTAGIGLHSTRPRRWSEAEIELSRLVAERLWEAIERTRAEEALRDSEWFYRQTLESIPGLVFTCAPDGAADFVSEPWAEFTGCPTAALLGDGWARIVHPDDRARTFSGWRAAVHSGSAFDSEYRILRADGGHRWFKVRCREIRDGAGHVVRWFGTALDIDDLKRAEDALLARTHLLTQVAEASRLINTSLSADDIARVLTEEARRILGAHQSITSLTHGPDWARATHAISLSDPYAEYRDYDESPTGAGIHAEVCRTNRPMRMTQAELEAHPVWRGLDGARGRHPPLHGWLAVPLVGQGGRNLGLVQLSDKQGGEFTAEDEAVLVQLAAIAATGLENARLYDSLREADRRKDEFLATLAHELRNPLAPLRTGLQLVRRAPHGSPTAERARDIMERQLAHMVRLVDDLLDVSRVSRGKVELRRERVDVGTILEHAVETSRPLIDAGRHALTVRAPDPPLWTDGDLTRLAQVISNLLNNAAKFTPSGGRIELSAAAEGAWVVLRVRDNGAGIPADMLPRVFDMFAQVDRTLDRAQGGLGIGLALARKLVEMHGGTTEVESPGLGLGSTFTVRLPLTATGEPASAAGGASHTAPRRRVLVVDDNVDGAESLALLLELAGHETATAHAGLAALAVAGEFAPDVVLLDIGLPELDGYDVARRLRADPRTAGALLVALTGWGSDADKRRSREAGFDAHLTKPVDAATLTEVLARPRRRP